MWKKKPPFRLALSRAASDEIARHCKHYTERGVMKLHESGTALAEGMGVPVSKMPGSTKALCQASLETAKDPDRGPYPAYPSGKSCCEAWGKTGSGKKFYHNVMSGADSAAQHRSSQGTQRLHRSQQRHQQQTVQRNKREDAKRQREREREEERRGERGRGDNGRKSEEQGVRNEDEEGDSKVVEDVTGWVEVRRRTRRKVVEEGPEGEGEKNYRKAVQIFVKVDEAKVTPMEISLTDGKVEDVMRQVQKDEDVYVTMHGRVLRRNEKLKSCGVSDGCTIEVTSRMRGGGKHKDKKGQKERKRAEKSKGPEQEFEEEPKRDVGPATQECDKDTVIQMIEQNEENRKVMVRMLEENEDNRKMIESMSEGSDTEMEQEMQNYRTACREILGWSQEQVEVMERGLRWAVEAKRKGRETQTELTEVQEQHEEVRFREEEQSEVVSTDEQNAMSGPEEAKTGRGRAGLVPGGDESRELNETRKGKGKGNGGKGEHEGKGGGFGRKGTQQTEKLVMDEIQENHREDVRKLVEMMQKEEEDHEGQRGRVAPNMEAGGSHPQATSDPGKGEKEKEETRVLSWADCNDEEVKENEEEGKEEKETGQREMTDEGPPGLEEMESEPKTQEEEKHGQVESEQEAREQARAQKAREEEQRRAREAREEEEQRRAREAREEEEQRRARKAREEEKRAHEAREEKRAQETREERRAQEERKNGVKAQDEREEDANSLREESHVSNRHMTWWQNAWWVRVNNGPHLRTARDRRKVWRAATRAAQEVRETGKVAGREREEWEKGKTERRESNTLHIVLHLQPTAAAPAAAAVSLHEIPSHDLLVRSPRCARGHCRHEGQSFIARDRLVVGSAQ